ncbi:D-alanyl-D-alanine carboxypeptidase/D-alanyl-D-alanine endopeptidase [Modestobacter sp. SYSU DS0511]
MPDDTAGAPPAEADGPRADAEATAAVPDTPPSGTDEPGTDEPPADVAPEPTIAEQAAAAERAVEDAAAERVAADQLAAEAAEEAEARRAAAAQAAADLAEVKRWIAERAAAEQAAAEEAAQLTAEDEEAAAAAKAAADLAEVRRWAAEKAAAEQAAEEQAAAEQAAFEQAEAERAAALQAEADRMAAERAEVEQAVLAEAAARRAAEQEAAARAADEAEARRTAEREADRRAAEQAAAARADEQRAEDARAEDARAEAARAEAARAEAERPAAGPRPDPGPAAPGATPLAALPGQPATGARPTPGPRPTPAPRPAPAPRAAPEAAPAGATAAAPPTRRDRRAGARRRGRALLAALLVLVVAAVAVVLVLRFTGNRGSELAEQVPDAVLPVLTDPSPVLTELSGSAPLPDPAVLSGVLTPLLADPALGSGLSAQVVDVATGGVLFDLDGADPGTPASTAKLLTALAALTTLDPVDTLTTTVVAGATPGEVVLVGGGDPTLSTTEPSQNYPGAATVAELAAEVRQALGGTAVTRVVVDNSLFTGPLTAPGWGAGDAPSTYAAPVTATAVDGARVAPGGPMRSGAPGTDAGRALAAALGVPEAPVALGEAPAGARTLGSVESAPVVRLVEQALTESDNLLAESLARHVAIGRGLPADFAGAAQAVTDAVADAGLDTTGVALSDGSGLSSLDRVPAQLLTRLLRGVADGNIPGSGGLLSGLPVAGYDGTLAERPGAGQAGAVRAKTGTLNGVHDLAGTVLTDDGRLLAFAVLADGATGGLVAAEAALDEVTTALAACGCR